MLYYINIISYIISLYINIAFAHFILNIILYLALLKNCPAYRVLLKMLLTCQKYEHKKIPT